MTSRRPRRALLRCFAVAVSAAACGGCGRGAHDLAFTSGALVVIKGHVDLGTIRRPNPDPAPQAPLIGALVWAKPAAVDPVCLEFASDRSIAPLCPDPYGVFNGEVEAFAPVDANGDFDLPLTHLPMVSVSVGDATTRIAYGSLMVVEDVDGDGQPTLLAAPDPNQLDAPAPEAAPAAIDRIVAATFYDLNAPQVRVAFREGGFIPGCPNDAAVHSGCSYFYPLVGCEPPSGFSIVTAPAYSDPSGACSTASPDARIDVPPLSPPDAQEFLCRAVQIGTGLRQARDRGPRGVHTLVCLTPDLMAAVYPGFCSWLRSYALKGCAQDPLCATPEWDFTMSPPSWWTCP